MTTAKRISCSGANSGRPDFEPTCWTMTATLFLSDQASQLNAWAPGRAASLGRVPWTKPTAETTERPLAESERLLARARELIPGATQTLSKGPTQWVQGVAPAFVARAHGAHVWDVDGN